MLNEKQIIQLQEALDSCARPMFLFHDDPDGSTSFMQLYRVKGDGKGVIVKTGPKVTVDYLRKVQEFGPDRIFIMDLALVDPEFIQRAGAPVVWLDHHGIEESHGAMYINSRSWGETTPPCFMCYQVAGKKDPWLAMVGCVGDWYTPPPELVETFNKLYPGVLTEPCGLPEEFMFKSRIGELVQILSFNLKGKSDDAMSAIKVFSRLDGPMELLENTSARANWLVRRYQRVKKLYERLKALAVQQIQSQKGLIVTFITDEDKFAITKDLANELSFLFPDKVLIAGRVKDDEIRISLRTSRAGPVIDKVLERALVGINATGGGHEHACGTAVRKDEFKSFVENLERELARDKS